MDAKTGSSETLCQALPYEGGCAGHVIHRRHHKEQSSEDPEIRILGPKSILAVFDIQDGAAKTPILLSISHVVTAVTNRLGFYAG